MKKSLVAVTAALAALSLSTCGPLDEPDEPGEVRSSPLLSNSCPGAAGCLPTTVQYLGKVLEEDELGPVESELINGLAKSGRHWYWSNQYSIQRVPLAGGLTGSVDKSTGIPRAFTDLGYNHIGDIDFYGHDLFVPITGGPLPVVLVFDEDLNLRSWGALGNGGGGFLAINPADHRLYSADPYLSLVVYEVSKLRPAEIAPTADMTAAKLGFVGTIPLQPINGHTKAWFAGAWIQGGAFSPNGVFYYVLDHGTEDESRYTGVYVYDVTPFGPEVGASAAGVVGTPAPQVFVSGDSPEGIMAVSYDPIQNVVWVPVGRGDELEGIAVYRGDDDKIHVLVQKLSNEADDDDVTIYQWTTNEPRQHTPASPTVRPAWDDWTAQFKLLGTEDASDTAAAMLINLLY